MTSQQILDKYPNLPKQLLVTWNLYCANDVKYLMKDIRSLRALEVTAKWLVGEATEEELEIAAKEARDIVSSSASDAYSAAASYAASYSASYAASYYAAYYTPSDFAAHYASLCYPEGRKEKKYEEYRDKLLQLIDNMSEIEKVLFLDNRNTI